MTTSQAATAAKPPVVNIANAVTVLRLLLVPVFVWVFYQGRHGEVVWTLVTVGVFLAAAATDRLDGYLARTRGLVTDFGKIADPIVDKILIAAGLICLWLNNSEVSLMVVLVILLRELIVTVIRLAVVRKRVIAASAGGKLKTFLQVTAICMYILLRLVPDSPWATTGVTVTMIVTVAVTVYTGLEYIYQAWPYLVKRSKPKPVSPSADVTKATVAAGPAKSAVHPDRPVEGWDETRSVPQEPRAPGERGSTTTVLQAPSWAAVERPAEGLASTKGKAAAKGQPKTPAVAAKPPKAAAGSGGVPAASAARAGIPIVMADAPPGGLAAPAKAGSTRPVAVPAASAARAGIPIVMADAPPGGLAAPAKAGSARPVTVPAASAARAGIPIVMADASPGGLSAPAKAGSPGPVTVPAASAARAGIPIVVADAPPGGLAAPAKAGSAGPVTVPAASANKTGLPKVGASATPGGLATPAKAGSAGPVTVPAASAEKSRGPGVVSSAGSDQVQRAPSPTAVAANNALEDLRKRAADMRARLGLPADGPGQASAHRPSTLQPLAGQSAYSVEDRLAALRRRVGLPSIDRPSSRGGEGETGHKEG